VRAVADDGREFPPPLPLEGPPVYDADFLLESLPQFLDGISRLRAWRSQITWPVSAISITKRWENLLLTLRTFHYEVVMRGVRRLLALRPDYWDQVLPAHGPWPISWDLFTTNVQVNRFGDFADPWVDRSRYVGWGLC